MNEDVAARQQLPGRVFCIEVTGDTADEIELAALDAARRFFGSEPQLEVARDYIVIEVSPHGAHAASGKKYHASARVRTIEP